MLTTGGITKDEKEIWRIFEGIPSEATGNRWLYKNICGKIIKTVGRRSYMNKMKIYLDTSVIRYLDQKDVLKRMKETQKIWDLFKKDSMIYIFPMWWCMRLTGAAGKNGKFYWIIWTR